MVYLVLLRHGESSFNKGSRFCGWIDAPLSENGEKQAIETANRIMEDPLTNHIPIHLLVTSRLKRAILTANIILEQMDRINMDVIKTWRLNERHYGCLQGKVKKDVLNEYGKEKYMFYRRAYNGCPLPIDINDEYNKDTLKIAKFDNELIDYPELIPKCESLKMVIERLKPFWDMVIVNTLKKRENVLCVTHGSVVRALLTILYELTDNQVENLNIPNGMPILIELDDETLKPSGSTWTYLDPERAKIEAEKVKHDGIH